MLNLILIHLLFALAQITEMGIRPMAPENCMVTLHYNIKLRKCSSLQKQKS